MARWLIVLLVILYYQVLPGLTRQNSPGIVLGRIMDKFFTDSIKVVTIQTSSDSTVVHGIQSDLVSEALASRKTLIPILCGNVQHMDLKYLAYYNVFLVTSYRSFRRLYNTLNPWAYDYTGRFIIVLTDRFQIKIKLLELMLEDMWRKKILNAIVIIPGEVNVEVYSYFPYQPGGCGHAYPLLVANISLTGIDVNLNLFPNQLTNMHGCVVKAGTYPLKPFSIIENNSEGQTTYKGTEINIVKTVAELHNFTTEFHLPENGAKWGFIRDINSTGLMGMIQNEEVDLGFGTVGVSVDRSLYLKAGIPHSTSTFVFAVPPGRLYTSFEKLYKPFTAEAWTFLGVAFTAGMMSAKLFFSNHNANLFKIFTIETMETPLLNLWMQIMGLPLPKLPRKNTTLAMVVGWMLTGLIVRTLYQGAMFQYLHAGEQTKSVQTVDDINAAGLHYYMWDVTRRFFVAFPFILNRTKPVPENEDVDVKFRQLLRGDFDGVLVQPAATVAYFNQENAGREHVEIAKDIVATYIVCIYYPKNSHLPEIFDTVILNLHGSGLLSYWRARYGDVLHDVTIIREHAPLVLDSVSGVFMIWLLLLTFCTLVFCVELVCGKCQVRK